MEKTKKGSGRMNAQEAIRVVELKLLEHTFSFKPQDQETLKRLAKEEIALSIVLELAKKQVEELEE